MLMWYLLLVVPAYFLLIVSANVAVSFIENSFLQDLVTLLLMLYILISWLLFPWRRILNKEIIKIYKEERPTEAKLEELKLELKDIKNGNTAEKRKISDYIIIAIGAFIGAVIQLIVMPFLVISIYKKMCMVNGFYNIK
ncbi:Uncharacterised protein [Listeria grayi]|uniref:Uncharacterized protein n=1 Tax=Listeria grayi TaxID=1641 RepID=A0A378MFA1_LISGR|nr:hypothetical protein [Listeria grayi]STY44196.1 Uncharacterised protein [Listeria grayi]